MPSEVPSGWQTQPLRKLGKFVKSKGGPKKDESEDGVPVVRYGELYTKHDDVIRGFHSFVPSEVAEKKYTRLRVGDVLFAGSGETLEEIGKSAAFLGPEPAYGSGDIIIFRPGRDLDPLFVGYASNGPDAVRHKSRTGQGSSVMHIYTHNLEKLPLSVPPLPEQKKIAAILSSVDEAIQATQAVIEQTRRVKEGLLQDLLTRGIGHTRFKQTKLGKIPETWSLRPANEVCEAVIDCKNRTPPETETGFAVVRTPNVRNGRFVTAGLKFTDEDSYEVWTQRGRPQPGDVLITREAPVGEVALLPSEIGPACLGQRMMMYRPDPAKLDNEFMLAALLSPAVQGHLLILAGGSTVGHVRVGDIRTLPIPVAPLPEQRQIARIMRSVGTVESGHQEKLNELQKVKAGLLQDLLTGKVRVSV
ncbi:MAG: restriction endonuclease subunit S [Deltaproteobacteria bacterium]|nr:MAG: restriction endonuclease subunit S [Deltaproteobacteria bacterium]